MNIVYTSSTCCVDISSAADIRVGYEMTVSTTSEGEVFVELCAIIYEPDTGVAPRPFVISYVTTDNTAGECSHHILHMHSSNEQLVNVVSG